MSDTEEPKIFARKRGRPRKDEDPLLGSNIITEEDMTFNPPADQAEYDAGQRGMTVMQWLFCNHYANTLNIMRSAILAGYSRNSAYSRGAELLQLQKIRTEIARIQKNRVRVLNQDLANKAITHQRVLEELAYIAFFNPVDCYDENHALLPVAEMPEPAARAIGSIEMREIFEGSGEERAHIGVVSKMKPWDKLKALEILAKNLGLLNMKVDIKNKTEITQRVQVQHLQAQFDGLEVEDLEKLQEILQKANRPQNLDDGNIIEVETLPLPKTSPENIDTLVTK